MSKRTPSRSRRPPRLSELELVRQTVSEATGAHFEVVPPHPAFPLPADHLDWFMRCRNAEEIAKSPYLNVVWREKGGGIWLESLAVGDTVDWIDLAYGEEQAAKSLDIDYSRMADPAFRDEMEKRYPVVMGRIREYEAVAAEVAKKSKAHLEIRRAGSKGMLVFTVAARVKTRKGAKLQTVGNEVRKGVSALKEAYEQIGRL